MKNKTDIKEIEKLFELGAHLGHKKSRLHPKARKNVYRIVNGTSVIDLTQTVDQLDTALTFLTEQAKKGKNLLLVGTKKVASNFLKEYAEKKKIPFITNKWLPGLLTNFETLIKNVQKLESLKKDQETGAFEQLVKHERIKLSKEISKLERLYGGLVSFKERPDIILMVDPKKEKNALKEAAAYKIPIVALVDTNSNPDLIEFPVVANDDTAQVVEYIMKQLLEAYSDNFKEKVKESKPKKEIN